MLVGISGFAQSGKDTVADYLVSYHGFTKLSFADPLKDMLRIAFGFSDKQLYSRQKELPDERYPFAGVCLRCHQLCRDYRELPEENPLSAGYVYWCARCELEYPEYVTPRLAAQSLGTEWGRSLYKDLWVNLGIARAKSYNRAVFADVRFHNEVGAIHKAGGFLIRVRRSRPRFKHLSETEMLEITDDAFDLVIHNDASIPELEQRVSRVVASWVLREQAVLRGA